MSKRYFVENLNGLITEKQTLHHMINVDKIEIQKVVTLICSKKSIGRDVIIKQILTDRIIYEFADKLEHQDDLLDITILNGIPKIDKNEFIVKYGTIFGAKNFIFCQMDRSIAKISDNISKKIDRLNKIARSSCELANRYSLPKITYLDSINKISYNDYEIIFVCDENNKQIFLKNYEVINKKILVIIGPEGGLSEKERLFFREKGAHNISLGTLIFPTEAASLAVLTQLYTQKNNK